MKLRVGHGFDMHPLVAGRPLRLGGVTVPHDAGLAGHSDADVVLHAVANALLGAIGAGDLGRHFPSSDPRYHNINSELLLGEVVSLVKNENCTVGNLDVSVVAQAPPLAPFVESMVSRIAALIGAPASAVNVKVSSPECIGALGRGEGIAAWAVVLLDQAD